MGFSLAVSLDATHPLQLLLLFAMGHALADYPLQGGFLATFKNRNVKAMPPGFDRHRDRYLWVHCLTAHALVHSAMVLLITGLFWLAVVELVLHWVIDAMRCEKHLSFSGDQFLHLGCKVIYMILFWVGVLQLPTPA